MPEMAQLCRSAIDGFTAGNGLSLYSRFPPKAAGRALSIRLSLSRYVVGVCGSRMGMRHYSPNRACGAVSSSS
jgi:hypothetical protein